MREQGLRAKVRHRCPSATNAAHPYPGAPHLLQRPFTPQHNEHVDRVWLTDIMYVPPRQGWLYLVVVLDLASRRVLDWAMKRSCTPVWRVML